MVDRTRNPNGIRFVIRFKYLECDYMMILAYLVLRLFHFMCLWLNQVDGDVKNPPLAAGTQDSISSIRSNAALVSATSAGSGYSAFA
jgi:hypothetical protein